MTQAVIFDLDGTLLNTLDDLADSVNFALESVGFPLRTKQEVRSFVGNGVRMLMKRSVPAGTGDEEYEKAFAAFREYYLNNMRNKTAPYPGITECLGELKKRGIKTAVVSNKLDSAVKGLCAEFFGSLISFSRGVREESERKPAPGTTLDALNRLNVKKENAVYVGDSDVDILTAKNAGLKCISVCWGFRTRRELEQSGAQIIIEKPDELPDLI